MEVIICPECNLSQQIPMFHCMRCSHELLTEARANGVQIILHFKGDVIRTVAICDKQQPVEVEEITVDGPVVHLTLQGGFHRQQFTSSLFNVLRRGAELWNLE